jgi:RNA:NAD 2'-phosphotransferase (TPT1/KptA family)
MRNVKLYRSNAVDDELDALLTFLGRRDALSGRVKLYHSTSVKFLAQIQREGLRPHEGGVGLNKHRVGVYLWRHREQAMVWAEAQGGIVLTVDLPAEMTRLLQPDGEFFEEESEAWVFPGTIPSSLIIEVTHVAGVK